MQHGKNGTTRPIRSKRDYVQAASVVETLRRQAEHESVAELRLQALIHEMEKYDDEQDGDESDDSLGLDYGGPMRRWSDDLD